MTTFDSDSGSPGPIKHWTQIVQEQERAQEEQGQGHQNGINKDKDKDKDKEEDSNYTNEDQDQDQDSSQSQSQSQGEGDSTLTQSPVVSVPVTPVRSEKSTSSLVPGLGGGEGRRKKYDVDTHVVQVANIAPQATREQMQSLFGYVGKIEDLRLYPTMDISMQYSSKICFVKFRDSASVGVAQHLTNTVFVDRAVIVIPYPEGDVPDETRGLELLNSGTVLPGIADPKLPQHVSSQLEGLPPSQMVVTKDPKLDELGLPVYPNLPPTLDSRRIEEIRRTVLIANLDPETPSQDVMELFSNAGEVKYLRLCTRDNDPLRYALIEFSEQPSVLAALQLNGSQLGSNVIKVYHSTQAIVKPQAKTNEAAQKEIEEAMTRQAQNLITQGLDTNGKGIGGKDKRAKSRSTSRERRLRGALPRRSKTRSPRRRSRSRSRDRRRRSRSRTRSPRRPRRSRSRSPKRIPRSPRRHRERSRSRDRDRDRRRSTSRSRHAKRSPSRDRDRRKDKDKKSKRDKERRSRSRDKDRVDRDRGRENKDTLKENGMQEEKPMDEDRPSSREKERKKDKRKSISRSPSKDKRRSTSRERKKKSKSKKKKRGDSDREDSVDAKTSSRNTSISLDNEPMEIE